MAKDKDGAPEAEKPQGGKKAEGQPHAKEGGAKAEAHAEGAQGESGAKRSEGKKAEGGKKGEAQAKTEGAEDQGKKDGGKKAEGGKKAGGGKKADKKGDKAEVKSTTPVEEPRRLKMYRTEVTQTLIKQFSYKNPMQVPRLVKISVNMGLGAAISNPKIIDTAVEEVRAITGQQPVVTRAKKAIATFKLRAGVPIGVMVTLRRERMWEFLDRFVSLALPRMRDFKGVSPRGFDGQGNYTVGLREQILFPEIDYDKIDVIKGLNISFITTAKTDDEGRALLSHLGMPFRS